MSVSQVLSSPTFNSLSATHIFLLILRSTRLLINFPCMNRSWQQFFWLMSKVPLSPVMISLLPTLYLTALCLTSLFLSKIP